MLNDPFLGGSHLPDITLVSPIHVDGELLGWAASRAHHADVGGMVPASMPRGLDRAPPGGPDPAAGRGSTTTSST